MKRRHFIKLIPSVAFPALLLPRKSFAAPGINRSPAYRAAASVIASSGGGGSCPADGSPSQASTGTSECCFAGNTANDIYAGQMNWNDAGTARTICKLAFTLKAYGDISGLTYHAYICSTSGFNINTGTPLATSNAVAGTNSWNGTSVYPHFTFASPYTTAGNAGTLYALVFGCGSSDGANHVSFQTGPTSIPGYYDTFQTGGGCAATCGGTSDIGIEIYWQ